MLAAEVQADLLILMSDVDGIYNKPPWEDGAKLMHTYTSDDMNSIEFGKKSKVSTLTQGLILKLKNFLYFYTKNIYIFRIVFTIVLKNIHLKW